MLTTAEHLSQIFQPLWQLISSILFCTLPLWWVVARFSIDPLMKLLLATIANFVFLYLLEFGAYLLSLPQWAPFVLLLASFVYSLLILFRRPFPWSGIIAWIALSVWILGLQSWIVAYGAASWYGDWYEHYERSIWFLEQQSPQQRFLFELWSVPARAPIFNAVCAMLMNSGDDFASFQVYATVLNTIPVLPLALVIRDMARFRQSSSLIWSVLICGIAPFAVQQETYTWTKFFTAGIILAAVHFYHTGMTQNKTQYVFLASCTFAVSILSHYLAVLFTIFFVIHFFYEFWKRKWNPRLIFMIVIVCTLLLTTWFGFIFSKFGFKQTFESTSTFGSYGKRQQGSTGEIPPWHIVFAGNMVTSTIPYPWRHDWQDVWRGVGIAQRLKQRDIRMGERFYPSENELDLQSEWFADLVTYPNSLLGALGFAGIVGLIVSGFRRIKRNPADEETASPGKVFWSIFFVVGIPLNVLASRDYSAIGLAHLNLQPFLLLVAVFLLRQLRTTRAFAILLLCLFVFESALISGAWISLQQRKLPISMKQDGQVIVHDKVHADSKYVSNYIYKLQTRAVYLSDKLGTLNLPFFFITTALAIGMCVALHSRCCSVHIVKKL